MNFSAFYDDILLDCPRCTVEVAKQAVRLAVRELCDRSRIWTYTTDRESALANVNEYEIDLPDDTEMVSILGGYFNAVPLPSKSADQLDSLYGEWQVQIGTPLFVTHNTPGIAIPVPYPDTVQSTDTLRWRVALRPTLAAAAFDDDGLFANDFYEAFLSGAKARLMLQASKPYTNLKLAEFHSQRWLAGINRARLEANRSRGPADLHVELPRI